MIVDWRADENNSFRMEIEINKSKVSAENERLATLDYDEKSPSFREGMNHHPYYFLQIY